jgi:hypothetical protein
MRFWSIMIVVLGALSYGMSLLGKKSLIFFFITKEQVPLASAVIIGIGVVLFIVSFFIKKKPAQSGKDSSSGDGKPPQA